MDGKFAVSHLAEEAEKIDVRHGSFVDLLLRAKTEIKNLGQPLTATVPCGLPCPSCGKNANLSKAGTVVATFGARPPIADFVEVASNMGGSDAHSVVAQSVIRNETRAMLDQFLSQSSDKSACIFKNEDLWKGFKTQWMDRLMKAAMQPPDESAELKWIGKKQEKFRNWNDDEGNQKTLERWLAEWEEEEKLKESTPSVSMPEVSGLPTAHEDKEATKKQKQAAGRFFDLDAKEYIRSDMNFDGDGNMTVRKELPGETLGTTVMFERVINPEGSRTKDLKHTMRDDRLLETEDLLKSEGKTVETPWAGNIFSKIMGKPFTEGTQCRYCEEIQADGSLLQRYQVYKAGGVPDEYVGRHLLRLERVRHNPPDEGQVERYGSPKEFVFRWLDDVSYTLRGRILEECERALAREKKQEGADQPEPEPDPDAMAAVREVAAEFKGKEFRMTALIGKVIGKKFPADVASRAAFAVLMDESEFARKTDPRYKPPTVDPSKPRTREDVESEQRKLLMQSTLFKKI